MIRTLNLNRETTAILENAFEIAYEKQVNSIWQASFSLPIDDPKVDKVELLNYVEIEGDLYRIIPKLTSKSRHSVTFQCEHVLATLLDSSLFKYHQLTGPTTRQAIEYILSQQNHKHWELRHCEITRYFHYSWENENGLVAPLFSIPKPFDEPYMWNFDTSSYPWQIDLIKPSNIPTARIKEGYNLVDFEIEENPMNVINRIYPMGAGEGVNQLTIGSINDGKPYLEDRKPDEEIREYIWVDKRFTNVESLKASGQALLDEWKKPKVTWTASAADVSSITGLSIDELKCGAVVRLDIKGFPSTNLRIMKESKSDIKGDPGNIDLEIGNVQEDLSTTQADIQLRQQINELYAQGATNIDSYSYHDNCDPDFPAFIEFPFPDDMINVNESVIRIKTSPFRAYTRGSEAGGHYQKGSVVKSESTLSGGGGTSGPSSRNTSGPSSRETSAAGGDHNHLVIKSNGDVPSDSPGLPYYPYQIRTSSGQTISAYLSTLGPQDIYTFESSGDHTHKMDHTHNMDHTHQVPSHKHQFEVEIPAINIPKHSHPQIYGVYEHDKMPSKLTVKIDGKTVSFDGVEGELDITDHLSKNSDGKIKRGYHTIEVIPNDLARINLIVRNRFFIQSQIGGTF